MSRTNDKFSYFAECKSFVCRNGVCLDNNLVCNGETDCEDGADENNCGKYIFVYFCN